MIFRIKSLLFVYSLLNTVNIIVSENDEHIICYFNSKATYVPAYGKFDIENIDPTLCTHVVYMSAGVDRNGNLVALDPTLDLPEGRDFYGQLNALKKQHPHLKTLLSVDVESIMARRTTQWIIGSSIRLLGEYGFDGLNLNWGNSEGSGLDDDAMDRFIQLLKQMKVNYDAHRLLLIAAVFPKKSVTVSYDIPTICSNLHIIGLKTFDLHGPWKNITGHHSPLHSVDGEDAVDNILDYWLRQGCPANKLVIGLSTYGRTYTLVDANVYKVGSPNNGLGHFGTETLTPGFISYYEHSYNLLELRWRVYYDDVAEVPYSVESRRWVSYDSPESLAKKAQYALRKQIAGVLIWTLDTDDFRRRPVNYPLLRAVNDAISAGYIDYTTKYDTTEVPTPTTTLVIEENSTETTPEPPLTTTETSVPTPLCQSEGFAPHPADCTKFILCMRNPLGQLVAYELQCPSMTALVQSVWDQGNSVCSLPQIDYCSVPTPLQKFMNLIPIKRN